MKLKKLFSTIILVVLSSVMCIAITACSGGGGSSTYTVRLDTNGGSIEGKTTVSVTYNEDYSFNTPTKTGYTFDGWMLNETKISNTGVWNKKENVTLKASWVAKTYTLTLDTVGGSGASTTSITVTYGQPVVGVPTSLTKSGYTFKGWKLNGGAFNPSNNWTIDGNATLVAEWGAKKFDVTIDVNGGEALEISVITATYGSPIPNIPVPVKTGYQLSGWKLNGSDYSNQEYKVNGNATLVAQWAPKSYTVTFNFDGGVADTQQTTVLYNSVITGIPSPTKTGYTLAGWKLDGNSFDATAAWNYDSDVTLDAVWSANKYTVTIDVNGGDEINPNTIKVDFGSPLKDFLPTLNKAGQQVGGWKIGNEDVDVDAPWNIANDTTTIVAQWVTSSTVVTFDVNGGDEISTKSANVAFGEVLVVPTGLTRTGYTFSKWTLNGVDYDANSNWSSTAKTETLKAEWTPNTYVVTLNVNNGTAITTTEYTATFGEALFTNSTLPTTTRTNYSFGGWTYNGEVIDLTSAWAIADDVTLVAKWVGDEYKVTLDYNVSGMSNSDDIVRFGEEYSLIKTRPGYTVDYWLIDGTQTRVEATGVWNVAQEVKLVAQWKATSYTIVVKDSEGNVIETVENAVTFNEAYDLTQFIPANDSIVVPGVGQKFFTHFEVEGDEIMIGHNNSGEAYDVDLKGTAWLGEKYAVDGTVITIRLVYNSTGTWY